MSYVPVEVVLSTKCNYIPVHAPCPRGQTPVLLNLGTMFGSLAKEGTFSLDQLSVVWASAMHLVLRAI